MLLTLLSTTALALTANAFLVPLEAAGSKGLDTVHPILHHAVLNCDSCPFAVPRKEGGFSWENGVKNNLVMDFTAKNNLLLMNGVPFYPTKTLPHLKAKQELSDKRMGRVGVATVEELELSYSLEVETHGMPGGIVTTLSMQVIGIEGKLVNVDAITIFLDQGADSILNIGFVTQAPSTSKAHADHCTTIKCRVRNILLAKLASFRAATKKVGEKLGALKGSCADRLGSDSKARLHGGPPKYAGKPHGGHYGSPQGYNHRHHGMHRLMHSISRVFKAILVPVLIGVAAGMAASAVGMLVGQIIVLLWIRFRRNATRVYAPVEQTETEVEEGLPKYEEAPKYEETEDNEDMADEKKALL